MGSRGGRDHTILPRAKATEQVFFLPLFTPYSCDYEPAIKGTTAISNCMIVSRILTLGFPSIVRFFFTMMTHRANSSRSRESRAKLRLRLLHFPPLLDWFTAAIDFIHDRPKQDIFALQWNCKSTFYIRGLDIGKLLKYCPLTIPDQTKLSWLKLAGIKNVPLFLTDWQWTWDPRIQKQNLLSQKLHLLILLSSTREMNVNNAWTSGRRPKWATHTKCHFTVNTKIRRKKRKKRTEMGQQIVSIGRVLARVIDSRESARAVSVNRYVVTRQRHLRSDHRNKSKNALWVWHDAETDEAEKSVRSIIHYRENSSLFGSTRGKILIANEIYTSTVYV